MLMIEKWNILVKNERQVDSPHLVAQCLVGLFTCWSLSVPHLNLLLKSFTRLPARLLVLKTVIQVALQSSFSDFTDLKVFEVPEWAEMLYGPCGKLPWKDPAQTLTFWNMSHCADNSFPFEKIFWLTSGTWTCNYRIPNDCLQNFAHWNGV